MIKYTYKGIEHTVQGDTTTLTTSGKYCEDNISIVASGGVTPTGTINITENGTHDVTNYATADVNVGQKTIYPFNDINFYDIHGDIVYSCSLAEIQQATSLPAVPAEPGLVAQGWNWTLADIKDNNQAIDVGPCYNTTDGNPHIFIHLTEDIPSKTFSVYSKVTSSTNVTINWGDGTSETYSGTTAGIQKNHTYANYGDYEVVISKASSNARFRFNGQGSSSSNITTNSIGANGLHALQMIKKVYFSNSIDRLDSYMFQYAQNLEEVVVPLTVTTTTQDLQYFIAYTGSLKQLTIPSNITTLGSNFARNSAIKSISLPYTVSSTFDYSYFAYQSTLTKFWIRKGSTSTLNGQIVYGCTPLKQVSVPTTMTSLGSSTFQNCFSLSKINLEVFTDLIDASAFLYCYNLIKIKNNKIVCDTIGGRALSYTNIFDKLKVDCKALGTANSSNGCCVFSQVTGLKKIWISKNCTSIGGTGITNAIYSPFYFAGTSTSALTIYLEADTVPSEFGTYWNYRTSGQPFTVVTGVSEEEFDAL